MKLASRPLLKITRINISIIFMALLFTACSTNQPQPPPNVMPLDRVLLMFPPDVKWQYQSNMTSIGLQKIYYPATEDAASWTQAFFIFKQNQPSASVYANQQRDAMKEVCPSLKVVSNTYDAATNVAEYVYSTGADCTLTIPRNKTEITKVFPIDNIGVISVKYSYVEGKVTPAAIDQGFAAVKAAHV